MNGEFSEQDNNFKKTEVYKAIPKMFKAHRKALSVVTALPGPEVIKHFSCSTQLSMKFFLHINVKIPTILTFMSGKIAF